jgi:hypothetical protein
MTSSPPAGTSAVAMRNHSNIERQTYNTTVQEVSQIQTKDTRRACSKTIFNLICHTEIKRVDSDSQQTGILASDALSVTMQNDP